MACQRGAPRDPAPKSTWSGNSRVCRRATGELKDIAFDTICGSGPNGAIIHYRVTESSNRRINDDDVVVIDSGGQYEDGTTDITRTSCFRHS